MSGKYVTITANKTEKAVDLYPKEDAFKSYLITHTGYKKPQVNTSSSGSPPDDWLPLIGFP